MSALDTNSAPLYKPPIGYSTHKGTLTLFLIPYYFYMKLLSYCP